MLHIALCDDELQCVKDTKQMIQLWSMEHHMEIDLHCFLNGDDLITKCRTQKFDIIFLDILMPVFNGIDIAKELRKLDHCVSIIFLTSSPEFAIDSYSVKATNYCLKPIAFNHVKKVLDDFLTSFHQEDKSITIKANHGYQKVYLHNIEFIEAHNKTVFIYLYHGTPIETTEPLYRFEDQLTLEDGFFKCHRSYLVYMPNIDYFNASYIISKSGRNLPLARRYTKDFKDAYFKTMLDEIK